MNFQNREAVAIENEQIRVVVLPGGGHIAAIEHKPSGLNPLWTPPWNSVDPVTFDPAKNPEFGTACDGRLLAGIMGHNLCLDIFGGPSTEEEAAGVTAHGEGSVARFDIAMFDIATFGAKLTMKADFPLAQIRFERTIELDGHTVNIRESAESLVAFDRPIGWTQHVTLGPPFLERGKTQFRSSAKKSKVFESEFGTDAYLKPAAEFEWPLAPGKDGTWKDLRVMNLAEVSSGYTAHAMDKSKERALFTAWSPTSKIAIGYVWKRNDFPWLGIWEENHSRTGSPWNGNALTRGMEFGASPFPESRREAVDRGTLFGIPTYRWLPAKTKVEVEYQVTVHSAEQPLEL